MIKSVFPLLLSIPFSYVGHAQRILCDETCKVEFQRPADEIDSLNKVTCHK